MDEYDGQEFEPVMYSIEEAARLMERIAVSVRAGLCHVGFLSWEGERGLVFFTGSVEIEDADNPDEDEIQLLIFGNMIEPTEV